MPDPIDVNNVLLDENKIIARQGTYTDFVDDTVFQAEWTNNTNNTTGELNIRKGPYFAHLVPVEGVSYRNTRCVKYFNTNTLSPRTGLPFPVYVDLRMEARVGKLNAYEDIVLGDHMEMLGFAVSHAKENFVATASNKFWVGIFRDGSNDGARIIAPDGTENDVTSISIGPGSTEHQLYVQIIYDWETSPTDILVNLWVDGVQAFTEFVVERSDLTDSRLDGFVGLAGHADGQADNSSAVLYWMYCAINRIESPISIRYRNSMLYTIPELNIRLSDFEFETMRQMGKDTKIDVYVREGDGLESEYVNMKVKTSRIPFSDADFVSNLLVRYELEGNVKDKSGNSNLGSLVGTAPTYVDYGDTKYVDLPGTDEYIDIPDLTFGSNITFAMWMKLDASSTSQRYIGIGQAVQSLINNISFYDNGSGDLNFEAFDGSGVSIIAAPGYLTVTDGLITGRWFFILCAISTTTITVYINGEMRAIGGIITTLLNVTRDEISLGRGWDASTTYYMNGQFKNFYLWNRALDADDAMRIYKATFLRTNERLTEGLTCRVDYNGSNLDEKDEYNSGLGATGYVSILGGIRQARHITSVGAHVLSNIPDTYDWSNGFTFAFWVKMIATGTASAQFGLYPNSASNDDAIKMRRPDVTNNRFEFKTWTGAVLNYTLESDDNDARTWQIRHVMIRQDSVNAKMYVDGVEVDSVATTSWPNPMSRTFALGSAGAGATGYSSLNGYLWDFKLWNRALSDDELDTVYRSTVFRKRWSGTVYDVEKTDETGFGEVIIPAYHISRILDGRFFTGEFSAKTADFILTDPTTGVLPQQAAEFDDTNIDIGKYSLDKEFLQMSVRNILLRLAADEDYLVWVDNDKKIYYKIAGSFDDGNTYEDGDNKLIDYTIQQIVPEEYTDVEIHSTSVWEVYSTGAGRDRDAIRRTLRIIDPTVKNQADAEFVAARAINNSIPITIANITVIADYTNQIGNVAKLTINEYNIINRKFIITEIEEDPDDDIQILTLAENVAQLADYFFNLDNRSTDTDTRDMDKDSPKTNTEVVDVDVAIWFEYLVEVRESGSGTWVTHASGEGEATNRTFAIVSGNLANRYNSSDANEGDIIRVAHRIGGSNQQPQITDRTLAQDFGSAVQMNDNLPTESTGDLPFTRTSTGWVGALAAGKLIQEAGFFIPINSVGNTTYKFGTDAIFAPYNNDTDLLVRIVFPAFLKNVGNQIRVTYTWRCDTIPKKRLVEV